MDYEKLQCNGRGCALYQRIIAVAFPMGNIVFPTHKLTHKHHIAQRIAKNG